MIRGNLLYIPLLLSLHTLNVYIAGNIIFCLIFFSNLIGQFGVGFYSVFMVAEKVSVHSRAANLKSEAAVMWESTGEDTYQLSNIPKENRGTTITIYLNDENKEFSELMRVKFLLQKYSQYINFPLILHPEEGEPETINDSEAIWLKSKRSVKADEYKAVSYTHLRAHET